MSAGATSTRPNRKNSPPSATSANVPDSKPPSATTIISAPRIVPLRLTRCAVSPSDGRSTSIGVTRLALSAGSSPARSVTPTPRAMDSTIVPGWMIGPPIWMLRYCL